MGILTITLNGSFGTKTRSFSAMDNGHAQAVAQAMEWLSSEVLPESISQDHELQTDGDYPLMGFRREKEKARHMNFYKCDYCGYEGPCYGAITGHGVSAPWCFHCGKNDKLTPIA